MRSTITILVALCCALVPVLGYNQNTEHGHAMPDADKHNCHTDALRLCVPHKGATLHENVVVSRFYGCLMKKKNLMPRECRHFTDNIAACVDDIQTHCSGLTMVSTVECMDEKRDELHPNCVQSHWFKHHLPQDHERQTRVPPHHVGDDDDELIDERTQVHVLSHDEDDLGEPDL